MLKHISKSHVSRSFSLHCHCQSCRRQAGRQGTLVTARQSNRWDLPFPLVCLLSRSLPLLHTYTCTTTAQPPHIKTNTHHSSPLERSISRDHTASSGSQALLTRSVDVDGSFTQADSWPSIITRVRGPATPSLQEGAAGGCSLPRLQRYWREAHFVFSFVSLFFSWGQMSNVKACSGSLSN